MKSASAQPRNTLPVDLGDIKAGRVLDKYIALILILTAFVQPLVKYQNEFIWLKITVNQVVLTVVTILFLLKVRYLRKIEIPFVRTLIPVAAMIVVGFLSVTQAENLYRSFDYSLRIGANLLYYFFFLTHIRMRGHYRGFFWAVLSSSFFVALYGILQFYEIANVPYDIYQEKDPSSTIGLTNFCSEYLITVLPLIVFGFFMDDFTGLKPLMAVLFLPIYFYFLITKARAAWLGFLLSGILSLVLIFLRWRKEEGSVMRSGQYLLSLLGGTAAIIGMYIYVFATDFSREVNLFIAQPKIWIILFVLSLAIIGTLYFSARRQVLSRPFYLLFSLVVIGVFVLSFSSYGKLKQFRSIFSSLSPDPQGISVEEGTLLMKSSDPSIDFRFQAWMSTLKTFYHNPILGVGLGNLEVSIHPYQVPKLQNTISKTYQVFSEAHNDYLHILSEVGILGFGAFVWLLVEIVRLSLRLLRKDMDTGRFLLVLGTQAGILGTLIAAIFSFPLQEPASSMNFWFLVALMEVLGRGFADEKLMHALPKGIDSGVGQRDIVLPLFQEQSKVLFQKTVFNLLLLLSIAGIIYLPLYSFKSAMAENYVKEGIALRNQRYWGMSEVDFTKAIQRNPNSYIYYFHRAIVRYNQGNMMGTEDDLKKSLVLSPKFGLAYRILGGVYLSTGRAQEALESLKMAVLYLPPISREVGGHIGQIALELRRPDDIVSACETALHYDPNRPDLLTYLGKGYYLKGEFLKATEALQKAIILNPRLFDAQLNLALSAVQLKNFALSSQAFHAAAALNPTSATLWFGRAIEHSLEGNKKDALEALGKAVSLEPRLTETARREAAFDVLKEEKRFQDLVQPRTPRK